MRSFLGVPIVARGEVIAAFYLTDREGADDFDAERPAADRDAGRARGGGDRERAAARAQPRAEHRRGAQPARARAARLGQPEAVRHRARPPRRPPRCSTATPAAAAEQVARLGELAQEALARAARADLRAAPASLEEEGLAATLRKQVDMLAARARARHRAADRRRRAAARRRPRARCCGSRRRRSTTRCATPRPSGSSCASTARDGRLVVTVADDGVGFDPAAPRRALAAARA